MIKDFRDTGDNSSLDEIYFFIYEYMLLTYWLYNVKWCWRCDKSNRNKMQKT